MEVKITKNKEKRKENFDWKQLLRMILLKQAVHSALTNHFNTKSDWSYQASDALKI